GHAVGDLHVRPGGIVVGRHRVTVVLVRQLLDRHRIALAGRGRVELGQHPLAVGRAAQELNLRLHPLHEAVRTLDAQAAAGLSVNLDVDHGRARAGGGIDQVTEFGIDGGAVARALDGVATGAGIDAAGAAGGMEGVVAQATGHHVAGAATADGVVADPPLEEVAPGATVDAVVAVAAVDHIDAGAALEDVVATAAEHVVAA